jgi:mono/diheme cytochrome c family protein
MVAWARRQLPDMRFSCGLKHIFIESRNSMHGFRMAIAIAACGMALSLAAKEGGSQPGLIAAYSDPQHQITTLAPTPDFVLSEGESLHPQLAAAFTAEWDGVLKIVKRAKYTFSSEGNADAAVMVDGRPINADAIDLDLGDHPIHVKVARKAGAVRFRLMWAADYFALEPVPSAAFSHNKTPSAAIDEMKIEAGHRLVEDLNCVGCHHSTSTRVIGRPGPDLATVGTRLHSAWFAHWLADPSAFRPGTRMPKVTLKADEQRDVAAYLATLKNPANKIKEPPPSAARIETGKQLVDTIGCKACHDGANGNSLDGIGSKWLPGQLAEYLLNPQSVDHSGRMPSMLLQKDEALAIAEYLVQSKNPAFEAPVDKGDPKHGEVVYRAQGCASCHVNHDAQNKPLVATERQAMNLEAITAKDHGCLAEHPAGRAMDFRLNASQRDSIAAFIASVRQHPMATAAPGYQFEHKARALGCVNCHELNASKPADESERLPQLTNVGGRLRVEWIGEVLMQKRRVRPWLRRRMPEFAASAVGDLPQLAVAASGVGPAEALPTPTREEIIAGQKLLGSGAGGFGCITCHGFAGAKPNVIDDTRGPDITTVASRLRPDHFRRWVLDPKRVSPSTPMPSFFDGIPVAEAASKVETMFRYVAAGENMPPPNGWVDKNNYQVAIHEEPVIIRTFMPNPAGGPKIPRGIAVGLPGLVNYCFDADTCTLRYAWAGGFLDMKPSWSGRGGNVVQVLGRRFYENASFPFRVGEDKHVPELKFQGYELVDKVPVFLFTMDGISVRETIDFPAGKVRNDAPVIFDTFEIATSAKSIYVVAPTNGDIQLARGAKDDSPRETLGHGDALKLGDKPGKLRIVIPLKETK